jgi:hypothetical protein
MVAAAFDYLAAQNEPAHRLREMRQMAWQCHNANYPRCWPQWRRGFQSRYGKRVDAHDYGVIPRYDQLHGEISAYFQEFAGQEHEYKFWQELLAPLPALITDRELWAQALAAVAEHKAAAADRPELPRGQEHDTTQF